MDTTTIGNKGIRGTAVAPRAPGAGRRAGRSRSRRTSTAERFGIYATAAIAGVVALVSPAEPVAVGVASALIKAAFAAGITLAASRARRWTWLVMGGLAVVGSTQPLWLGFAAAGVVVALAATFLDRRRLPGAVSAALTIQALLHLPDHEVGAGTAALVLVAVAPVLISAYLVSPRRVRRRIHRVVLVAVGVLVLAGGLLALTSLLAYSSATRAAAKAKDGLEAVRNGNTADAAKLLGDSSTLFEQAHSYFAAPWAKPLLVVPVVSQQAQALETMTAEGARVSERAAVTARQVDYEGLKYQDGKIDLDRVRAAREPLARTADDLAAATAALDAVRSPWLVAPVAAKIDEFDRELRKVQPAAATAASAAREAPAVLGGDGPRRYFVAFTTPAEERGLGGFMGSWAILTADNGEVEMTLSGRASDLNTAGGTRDLTGPDDYLQRYQRFRPQDFIQDVTFSPDLPTVAEVVRQLYPQRTGPNVDGGPIDGVLVVDPYGLAALLELTGPVRVEGLDEPLTSKNAVDVLLRRQYLDFATNAERRDALDAAGRSTFEKLVSGSLPAPGKVADTLGPAVTDKHIMFRTFADSENDLFRRVGADGAFPRPDGQDLLAIRTQNKGNNKADIFLKRKIEYRPVYDPATGALEAKVRVTLTNESPTSGLPEAFLGSNDQGLPPGTNQMFFSIYSPLGLRKGSIDGQEQGFELQKELGWSVYSRYLTIPPGGSTEVVLDLFGSVDAVTYRLDMSAQPMANPDQVLVELTPSPGWAVTTATATERGGFAAESGGERAVLAGTLTTDYRLTARFREG